MPYSIELYFDDESNRKINSIRDRFKENNIPIDEGTKPHVSLLIFEDIEINKFTSVVKNYSKEIDPFRIKFSSLGVFDNEIKVIFLNPKVTNNLIDLQKDLWNNFKDKEKLLWNYYLPNNWVPHCTLGLDLNEKELGKAMSIMSDLKFPIEVTVIELGIFKFNPSEQIETYKL